MEKSRSPESVEPTAAFDVASLVLYGSRALPIRLKILLDQLFNQLPHPQVTRLLAAFGWTNEDYSRGYILQVSHPRPLYSPHPHPYPSSFRLLTDRIQSRIIGGGGGGAHRRM